MLMGEAILIFIVVLSRMRREIRLVFLVGVLIFFRLVRWIIGEILRRCPSINLIFELLSFNSLKFKPYFLVRYRWTRKLQLQIPQRNRTQTPQQIIVPTPNNRILQINKNRLKIRNSRRILIRAIAINPIILQIQTINIPQRSQFIKNFDSTHFLNNNRICRLKLNTWII